MNIMDYVDLSGIYQVPGVVYVFWEKIVNPPGKLILGSDRRLPSSIMAFREVGG